jgi:outer membrane lipoprotein-sorting protein
MKRQRTAGFACAAAALVGICAIAVCAAGAPQRDLFDDIYARGRGVEATLRTLTARFTETSTSRLLSTPIVGRGSLAVVRPDRIVLRYTDPELRTVLIDRNDLTLTWPGRGIRQRTDIGQALKRIDKYFVDKDPRDLRKSFGIEARVSSTHPNAWDVTMTPKRDQIREGLSRLQLWMDRTSLLLIGMRMEFPTGETKTLTFEDVVVNGPVDPALFSIDRDGRPEKDSNRPSAPAR